MRKEINPAVAGALIAIVLLVAGLFLWSRTRGRSPAEGRMQSDLDMSKMEKDPEKFKQGVEDLLKRDKERQGK